MGQDIYLRCGIMQENGRRKSGFQNSGVYTNQACVRPVMEQRVSWLQQASHYNSWFLDVAATGMVFDDFDPAKPTSQAQDAQNRMAGMAWIARVRVCWWAPRRAARLPTAPRPLPTAPRPAALAGRIPICAATSALPTIWELVSRLSARVLLSPEPSKT